MTPITNHKWQVSITLVLALGAPLTLCAPASAQQSTFTIFNSPRATASTAPAATSIAPNKDATAQAAFNRAWTVFNSPRCRNCHPAGDAPLQGDDSHVHIQNVKRGPNGHGEYGMKCSTCHQLANVPGDNMPPGNPKWALPPPGKKMVIVGKTPGEFCRQLKDPEQNGGRTLAQIIDHVSKDDLVGWGWDPGDGRTLPPLSRPDFASAMREWVDNGAACPQ